MHTPWPWPKPEYNNSDMGPGEWYDIPGIARYISKEEDARLIAAAPDGLEMARKISKQYENQDLNHVDFRIMAKQLADAFIKKATEPRP